MRETLDFRFSLWSLMLVIGLVSVALGVLFAAPKIWAAAIIILLLQIVPAALVVGLIWGTGNFRVFCMGALIPAGLTLLVLSVGWLATVLWVYRGNEETWRLIEELEDYDRSHRIAAGLSWLCSIIVGASCVAMRRRIARWRQTAAVRRGDASDSRDT